MSWLTRRISLHSNDTPNEELANGLTHLVGAVAALVGTVLLAIASRSGIERFANLVFGGSMIALFCASAAYHLSPAGSSAKRLFRLADHLAIFLLIAGTYTPVMTALNTTWSRWTLVAVWTLALVGMTLKVLLWDRFRLWQVLFFLAMGWLAAIRIDTIVATLRPQFVRLLIAGGLFYTAGTIVYAAKRLPYHHAIWHLFVLAGAGSFFWGIYQYL